MEPLVQVMQRRGAWIVRFNGTDQSVLDSEEQALEASRSLLDGTGGLILVHGPNGAILDRETVESPIIHRVLSTTREY